MGRREVSRQLLQGLHVLVVDANAGARALLQATLPYCGALVTVADSAEAALASIERLVPEAIVCALDLGSAHDGTWFVRRLRALPAHQGGTVPVIAVIDRPESEDPPRPVESGFEGHLRKPIDPWVLCRLIAGLAERQRGNEASAEPL